MESIQKKNQLKCIISEKKKQKKKKTEKEPNKGEEEYRVGWDDLQWKLTLLK